MEPTLLYDTTLRDGTQGENISFTADEKVKIALKLDDIGIHYIEGGWPGSNPKDLQFLIWPNGLNLRTPGWWPSAPPASPESCPARMKI